MFDNFFLPKKKKKKKGVDVVKIMMLYDFNC